MNQNLAILSLTILCLNSVLASEQLNRNNLAQTCDCDINAATINLSGKDIESVDASTFKGLSNLQYLYLDSNLIKSLDDTTFNGLSKLLVLHLEKNDLTKINDKVFKGLFNLDRLYLAENQIETIHQNAFKELFMLELLNLDFNQIVSFNKNTLVGLTHLDKVCFYDNPISVYFSDLLDDVCISNSKCIVYTSNPCPYGF